jgi:hypothetical protein
MKYKLKRDLPFAKAGDLVEAWEDVVAAVLDNGSSTVKTVGKKIRLNNLWCDVPLECWGDWFEEVDERWKPKQSEYYYFIAANNIECVKWCDMHQGDKALYEAGNCFRTRELAEQAAEQIKALLKEFHKNNP